MSGVLSRIPSINWLFIKCDATERASSLPQRKPQQYLLENVVHTKESNRRRTPHSNGIHSSPKWDSWAINQHEIFYRKTKHFIVFKSFHTSVEVYNGPLEISNLTLHLFISRNATTDGTRATKCLAQMIYILRLIDAIRSRLRWWRKVIY